MQISRLGQHWLVATILSPDSVLRLALRFPYNCWVGLGAYGGGKVRRLKAPLPQLMPDLTVGILCIQNCVNVVLFYSCSQCGYPFETDRLQTHKRQEKWKVLCFQRIFDHVLEGFGEQICPQSSSG